MFSLPYRRVGGKCRVGLHRARKQTVAPPGQTDRLSQRCNHPHIPDTKQIL